MIYLHIQFYDLTLELMGKCPDKILYFPGNFTI